MGCARHGNRSGAAAAAAELRLFQVSLTVFSPSPCYNDATKRSIFRRTEQMAGTKPRMTKQHTRAAALPGKPCFPTGAARCKRHPDSGAAGSAGALFCTRALSFASENDLMQVLGLIPGAVTPSARCSFISTKRFSPHRGSSACTRTITRPPCGCARTISRL